MNLERERSNLAGEAHNAGYVLHRLVSFARLMGEPPPPAWSLDGLDELAAALQDWAVQISSDLSNQTLADDLAVRTQKQRRWRKLRAELDTEARERDGVRDGVPPEWA
jgi:hypothetical protein